MPFPETKETLEEAGYVFDNDAFCRGCGEPIEWWITPNDKKMPMSVVAVKEGTGFFAKVVGEKRIPHWSNCPNAKDFKH